MVVTTVAEYACRYQQGRFLADSTCQQMDVVVRRFSVFCGRAATLDDLTKATVVAFMRAYGKSARPSTVNSKRRVLLTLWRAAAEDGLCGAPGKVARMREPESLPEAWTVDQVEQLVSTCRQQSGEVAGIAARHYWSSLVLAIYWTGARITAVRSVVPDDCRLDERYLIVRNEGRQRKRDRLYWLSDSAVAAIAAHYEPARAQVWPWPHCVRHFWRRFRRIVDEAEIPSAKGRKNLFHTLRRTTLSYTAAAGGMEAAQRQAGHVSPATTRTHYIDPRIAREQTASDLLPVVS